MNSTLECLTEWMTRQRWYAGKGRPPGLVEVSRIEWPSDDPDARVVVMLVRDTANNPPSLYHVPLVLRRTIPRGAGQTFIGRDDHDDYLFDGAYDDAYTHALLQAVGVHRADQHSHVHSGEQSNTSIIFDGGSEAPLVVKIFRLVHSGQNPDVVLQSALTSAGNRSVPRALGSVSASWVDTHDSGTHADQPLTGHLAFAQEFVPAVRDGWPIALDAAATGAAFTRDAEQLGRVTAEVHAALAECMPTRGATLGDIVGFVANWHQRLAVAISDVPELRELRPAIEAVYDMAREANWPALQRIHGDFHLGQVLRRQSGEWLLVDFEGEPLRPLAERSRIDSPLRDVAGMLRSFDYAVGSLRATTVEVDTVAADRESAENARVQWAHDARAAFLEGYSEVSGIDLNQHRVLIDAFELDKAVYEAMYEARHRPSWLPIPLAAIRSLLAHDQAERR